MMAERLAVSEAKLLKMSHEDVVQTLVDTKMTLAQSEFQALRLQVIWNFQTVHCDFAASHLVLARETATMHCCSLDGMLYVYWTLVWHYQHGICPVMYLAPHVPRWKLHGMRHHCMHAITIP